MAEKVVKQQREEYTLDGTVDRHGRPAIRSRYGSWNAGILLLGKYFSNYLRFFISNTIHM